MRSAKRLKLTQVLDQIISQIDFVQKDRAFVQYVNRAPIPCHMHQKNFHQINNKCLLWGSLLCPHLPYGFCWSLQMWWGFSNKHIVSYGTLNWSGFLRVLNSFLSHNAPNKPPYCQEKAHKHQLVHFFPSLHNKYIKIFIRKYQTAVGHIKKFSLTLILCPTPNIFAHTHAMVGLLLDSSLLPGTWKYQLQMPFLSASMNSFVTIMAICSVFYLLN